MPGHSKILNPRQIAFAQFVVGPDGQAMPYTEAARKAGYKDSPNLNRYATRIAQLPHVRAEIDRLKILTRATRQLTAENWHRELAYQYARVRDNMNKEGGADASDALRALEAWGKAVGVFDVHDGNERAGEVIAALAAVGKAMIEGKRNPKPIEGKFSLLAGDAPIELERD